MKKDHINSSQMADVFARDAPQQHRKDFRALNIQNMKKQEEDMKSRMAPQEQRPEWKMKQFSGVESRVNQSMKNGG